MSTLIARKLAKRAPWLPHGAQDYLDFRAGRYWSGSKARATLADAIAGAGFSFARASQASRWNASGTLAYAASDVPRLDHHPVTLAPLGLLLEGAKTIRITQPEALDNAYWTKGNGTLIDADQDVAPDGATTADRIRPPVGTSSTYLTRRPGIGIANGDRYVASAFVKAGGVNWAILNFFYSSLTNGNWFGLQGGVVGVASNGAAGSARPVGGGITRIGTAKTITGVSSVELMIAPTNGNGSSPFTGDAVKYFNAWGIEIEAAGDRSFPTSYAAGTARAADSLARTIATPERLTRQIGFTAPPGLGTCVIWQLDDGSEANRVRVVRDTSGTIRLIVTNAASETVNLNLGAVANESFNRVAVQFDGSAFKAVMNANPTVQSAAAAMPAVTSERLGSSATAGDEFCGWIGEWASYGSLADGGLREKSRVFPAWVQTDSSNAPADIYLDRVNGRYWADGVVYPTLDALKTALGATSYADDDWTFPWTAAAFTAVREGMAGNSQSAGHVYTHVQADAGGANYSAMEQGSGVNSILARTFVGATQFIADSTVMRRHDTMRHAATFKENDFGFAYNGGNLATDTSGALPSSTNTFRIGNNVARNRGADDGELWKLALFRTPKAVSELAALSNPKYPAIAAGDSFMDGSGSAGVPMSFARLARRAIRNLGVGGSTLAAQVTVSLPLIAAWPQAIFLHWDGKSNGYDADIAVDQARYATMVDAVLANGHSKFVIFCPLTSSYDINDEPVRAQRQRDLTTWLKASWPSNVIDVLPLLKTMGNGSSQDNIDIALDCVPTSLMRPDHVHLLQSTHDAIHNQLTMPLIDAAGWLVAE